MTQRSLAELVGAARGGDASAYEELYRQTANQMMGLALSMLKHEQDALDVLQDSYLYAFGKLEGLEKPESFSAWLYRLVANRCKNHLTRTRPKLFVASLTDEVGEEWELEDTDSVGRPDDSLDDAETKRLVMEMVDALPEDQRVCVLLHYFQEMKVSEIASLLDISENTVKSRLNYARKKLRTQVEALERQGTRLHGIALLPLLSQAAMDSAAQSLATSGPVVLQGVLQGIEVTAAGVTAAATAGGSATTAATSTSFLSTVGGKVVVGIVTTAVAVGGAVALFSQPEPAPEPAPVVSEAPVIPQEEPEPEPERIWEYVFDEQFPHQQGGMPLEEFYLRVKISEPAEVYQFDLETVEVWIGLQLGEEFQIVFEGTDGEAYGPTWDGDEDVLEMVGGTPLAPVYLAAEEGSGTLSMSCSNGPDSEVACRIYISVPGAPPKPELEPEPEPVSEPELQPQSEPEPASDGVSLTFLFQDEGGAAFDGIVAVGVRIGSYSIVLDDRITGRTTLYSEEERANGQTILTAAQAQELGIVWDFSYTPTSLSFSTREDCSPAFYYQRDSGSNSISRLFRATSDHTVVVKQDGNSIKWG